MKIVVHAIGSRGDVQPYVNLCQGLNEAGHNVILATNPTLCSLAESHGVKSEPVGPPVDMGMAGERLMAQSFNNMWIGMIRVMALGARLIEEAYPDGLRVASGADLLISSDTAGGIAEAEKLGVRWISCTLQPGRIPVPNPNPGLAARLVWPWLSRLFVAPTNRFRRRVGAPPAKDISDLMSKKLVLLPVSPHVAPPDPRWPSHVRQTGYWFARPASGWSPPQDLLRFLEAGEKPVAVSLGVMSLSGKQAQESAQIVIDAIQAANARAVVQGWDEALKSVKLPENIFHAGSLPHTWLFDRVQAVVHHGGFGTTAAVLNAGVPGIIIPHVIDQFYWGQLNHQLGTGPKHIPRARLSAQNLADAIRQAMHDETMRSKAAATGAAIRSEEDGVSAAVRIIEQHVNA